MVADHRGKALLVDFWATWCDACREEMPRLIALYSARKQRGFELVTISCDEPEQESAAADFLEQQHAPPARYIRRAQSDDAFINSIDRKWTSSLSTQQSLKRWAERKPLSLPGQRQSIEAIARAYDDVLFAVEHPGGRPIADSAHHLLVPQNATGLRIESH